MPKNRRIRNRTTHFIDILSLGEGSEKGAAFRHAQENPEKRIVAVSIGKPNYEVPPNMKYIQRNAISHVQSLQANSVRTIVDNYFFHFSIYGTRNMAEEVKKWRKDPKVLHEAMVKRPKKYVWSVMRALVPGGSFIITTDEKTRVPIGNILQEVGFTVSSRVLTKEEILKSGSESAKRDLERGKLVTLIIATKPE